jgi:hypothetical protein
MPPQWVQNSRASRRQSFIALAARLLLSGVVSAQNQCPVTAGPEVLLPTSTVSG